MTQSRAEIRERFRLQLEALLVALAAQGESLRSSAQRLAFSPDRNDWDGDLFNHVELGQAFSREEHQADVEAAIADVANPGTVGDLVASSLQGDFLSALERSFRLSNASRVRRTIHAAARRAGHGHEAGLFRRGFQGAVEGVLKQGKSVIET